MRTAPPPPPPSLTIVPFVLVVSEYVLQGQSNIMHVVFCSQPLCHSPEKPQSKSDVQDLTQNATDPGEPKAN